MKENRSETAVEHFYAPSGDMTERLRSILMANSDTHVSFDDAAEIGIQLLSLYECLARKRESIMVDDNNGQHG